MTENEIGRIVVDSAVSLHKALGPGLLESVYEIVLAYELERRGCAVARQVPIPIQYRDIRFDEGFRADIVVEGKVILELKSVEQTTRVHAKQVLTYLRLTGMTLGFFTEFWRSAHARRHFAGHQRRSRLNPSGLCALV